MPVVFIYRNNISNMHVALKSTSISLTHSWSWDLLEQLPIVQPLKNFPGFYGTRSFITVLTRAIHWSLSWARSIQSLPSHPISLRSILILSTYLRLGLPSGLFPSGFPTNVLYAFFSPIRVTCPVHLILIDLIILIILEEEYKWRSSSLCSFLQPPITSSLFGQNILLNTFSQTFSFYVPPLMSEAKFHIHTEPQEKSSISHLQILIT
jgi:hypothetical protein